MNEDAHGHQLAANEFQSVLSIELILFYHNLMAIFNATVFLFDEDIWFYVMLYVNH